MFNLQQYLWKLAPRILSTCDSGVWHKRKIWLFLEYCLILGFLLAEELDDYFVSSGLELGWMWKGIDEDKVVGIFYYFLRLLVFSVGLSDIPGKAMKVSFSSLYFGGKLEWFNFFFGERND